MNVLLPNWMTGAGAGGGGASAARLVDLSHPLTESTPVYPGDPPAPAPPAPGQFVDRDL